MDQVMQHSHTACSPTHSTMRKSHRMLTVTIHQEDKVKQPALYLLRQDDFKARKDTKQCTTKQGHTQNNDKGIKN